MAAFAVPNFRRFVASQTISLVGSLPETVAQAILVLQLTHSGVWLGLTTGPQCRPGYCCLLLTPYPGATDARPQPDAHFETCSARGWVGSFPRRYRDLRSRIWLADHPRPRSMRSIAQS